MFQKTEVHAIEAEIDGMKALLNEAKDFGDIVGQFQYEERIEMLREKLTEAREKTTSLANISLFFKGKPVLGSQGIAADFAGKALESFQDIVSKIYVKNEIGSIGGRGRLPSLDRKPLMVTGVARGSFGFVLSEVSQQDEIYNTPLKEALSSVSDIVKNMGVTSEESFERVIEDIDSRTLLALRRFFKNLDSSEATIRLVDEEKDFTLDRRAISLARERSESIDLEEKEIHVKGVFIGFVPTLKKFEISDVSGQTICGSASMEAVEQYRSVVKHRTELAGRECLAVVTQRTVRPISKPEQRSYRIERFVSLGGTEF